MKKVSKAILIGLGAVLALVVVLLIGLNIYIQSPSSQARIQDELSKALRVPLKLTNTSVSPWSDLKITGITIPSGGSNFLEAGSFTARYRLLPLLQGKLVITAMQVNDPHLKWLQSPDKKWKLPEPEKAAEVSREASSLPDPSTPEPGEKKPKEPKDKTPKTADAEGPKPKKKPKFAVEVQRFDIKNGTVEFIGDDKKPIAVLTGVNVTYTTLTAERQEGTATVDRAVWADTLVFENLHTPFVISDPGLSLPAITAAIGGSTIQGSYERGADESDGPFKASVQFENVDLEKVSLQAGGQPGDAGGLLSGRAQVQGDTRRPEKVEGTGTLDLKDGQFKQLEVIKAIGQIFIKELADLRFREGHAEVRVAGEKVYVEQLKLEGGNLDLSGKGIVRLDKKVNIDAQLAVDEAIVNRLPGNVPEAFGAPVNGRRALPFAITGTTDKLKTNLHEKLIAPTIGAQFGGLLKSFMDDSVKRELGDPKKKQEEDDKKKAEKKAEKDRKKKEKAAQEAAAGTTPNSSTTVITPAPTPATPAPVSAPNP